jgi:hypothetical protein
MEKVSMSYKELGEVGIKIYNKKNSGIGEYVARGSILGNGFKIGKDGDRDEVIRKYKGWLWGRIKKKDKRICGELRRLYEIWNKNGELRLSCYCAPLACHTQVIGSCLVWKHNLGK